MMNYFYSSSILILLTIFHTLSINILSQSITSITNSIDDLYSYQTISINQLPINITSSISYPVLSATLIESYGSNVEAYAENATIPLQITIPPLANGKYEWSINGTSL